MNKPLGYLISALIPLAILYNPAGLAKNAISCNQKYALCNTSACMQMPGMTHKALCTCSVDEGFSASFKSCKKRMATKDRFGNTRLVSSYSLANASSSPQMTCSKGYWASCLDAPCVVDAKDPTKAYCTCSIKHKSPYITQGGDCKTNTCATTLWSGASAKGSGKLLKSLMKATQIESSPVKNCNARGIN